MAEKKMVKNDVSLPFSALQLLAPPVRLVSAALWKVLKQRDVSQYGTVEEFVTSACETVPGLLTFRHQGKLALGLRGRLILELCRGEGQLDPALVRRHMERIRVPASDLPAAKLKKDVKIAATVDSFKQLVETLLADPAERELFYKEEFPVEYDSRFDQELEKLLWEFLIRLDQLLPVPNLAQTVSWLSSAPPVMEECARAATQPQLLKLLLQHQSCLGHLEPAASLPPNMGDSILASLSLPPSGRAPSKLPTGSTAPPTGDVGPSSGTVPQAADRTAFIKPVIGLISNETVPCMTSTNRSRAREEPAASGRAEQEERSKLPVVKLVQLGRVRELEDDSSAAEEVKEEEEEGEEEEVVEEEEEKKDKEESKNGRGKRKLAHGRETCSDEEGERGTGAGRKRTRGHSSGHRAGDGCAHGETLRDHLAQLGLGQLELPDDPSLRSAAASCLLSQPSVRVARLDVTPARADWTSLKTEPGRGQDDVREPRVVACDSDDKENTPMLPSMSPSRKKRNTEALSPSGDGEDYIGDSEDEATKNFKGRLFVKRYYKTKHDTYVPTLREFWKPWMARRNLLSPGSGRR